MEKRRILIIDNNAELRRALQTALAELGHEATALAVKAKSLARSDFDSFDLIISERNEESVNERSNGGASHAPDAIEQTPRGVEVFRVHAANFTRKPYDKRELREIVERVLGYKLRFAADARSPERIEFELPSDLSLMNGVLHYLQERVAAHGLIQPEQSNLFIALDEAFVNAVKHGNKEDASKLVRIAAELSAKEARFIIEDEGEGFDPKSIPDPLDPANMFKTSGRGVLLIYNIMDEVAYNERGNRVTMIKRADAPTLDSQIVNSLPRDAESPAAKS